MGKLETTIILHDKFSKKLEGINKSLQATARAMQGIQKAQLSGEQLLRYEAMKTTQEKQKTLQKMHQANAAASRATAVESKRLMTTRQITRSVNEQKNAFQQIESAIGKLATKFRNYATVFFGIKGAIDAVNQTIQLSDKMTMNDAKLNIVAGGDKKLKNELEAKTFAAAQRSTTDYLEFSKAVGKLGILAGDKFKNNDSIVRFVELMNKSFQISGAEESERNAAMLQITQAIASNRLQGDEFRSILENAPMVMQALTKSLGVGQDKLKAMAREGEITADVLIKAMFDAGSKIEEMYKQLDMTWERHWAKLKNVGVMAFKPIHEQFKRLFNSEKFQKFINGLCTAMIFLGNIGGWALGKVFDLFNWVVSGISNFVNWVRNLTGALGILRDIIFALTTALILYKGYQLIVLGFTKLQVLWTTIQGAATLVLEAIIRLARTAWGLYIACQIAYNGAATVGAGITAVLQVLMSNLAVIIGVVLVAALILFIMWLYKSSDSAADVVGKIVGSFYWLWTAICNIGKWIGNMFSGVCQWVTNAWDWCGKNMSTIFDNIGVWWNNLWVDCRIGFYNFINDVLSKLSSLAQKIQPLAELLDVDLSGMINNAQASITGKINSLNGKKQSIKSLTPMKSVDWTKWEYKSLSDAYDKGYKKGYDATTKVVDKIQDLKKQLEELKKTEVGGQKVTADALNGIGNDLGKLSDDLGGAGKNIGDTAKNTGDTAKNTSSAYEQDYSYLRNWSYQAGMGGSIGYEIKIEQNNRNSIASHLDIDKITKALIDEFVKGINGQMEGVR